MFLVIAACGGTRHVDREPEDYLAVGVDPTAEARALEASLASDGYRATRQVDGTGWTAFAMSREDGASVARLVTPHGVVVALDETPTPLAPARGVLDVEPAPRSGSDVDGDGVPDVVLARQEAQRRCLLVVSVDTDGNARPLRVDTANVASDLCVEDVRDVDGSGVPEAIVGVRAAALARASTPTAEMPLERDADGVYRRFDPAERFVEGERAARRARIVAARARPDAEAVYTAAVELALVSFVAGESAEAQVAAFDEGMTGVVLDVEMLGAVHFARGRIAAGRITE